MPDPVRPLRTGAAAPSVHVAPEWTTVPRYAGPAERGGSPHLVVVCGSAPAPDLGPADRLVRLPAGADAATLLDRELATLVTGTRILVTGPEALVQAVRAAALHRGALDEELVLVPTDVAHATRERTVHCAHCHQHVVVHAAVGDAVACPGCRVVLHVAGHHSRRLGAFLGAPTPQRAP
ncbi:dimethylamine monooxygenase subunit DmmA family protein [Pseudonocardia sp. ICBG1142]|uniref:dimethylamine monooxygenase subunit DmmA family protein n=2 Tax=unclassified Pseudonocardia TaxID=2619320 RepID=UPI001CF65774|nr:dimethylamine monooxygenase subunit DmmA family protein [Pseudonocardia sp. ICBG1142]